jgi:5-methylcytosine-specific restriction endonuclease McrA
MNLTQLVASATRGIYQDAFPRGSVFSIHNVMRRRKLALEKGRNYAYFDDYKMNMTSHRLTTFAKKGCTCYACGLVGSYFAVECKMGKWTLNLYGVNDKGEEVLMTRDHIYPKSLGGKNELTNHDTMCIICNNKKADHVEGMSS